MAGGLQLSSGLRFRASAAAGTPDPSTGTVDYAAFSPGSTQAPEKGLAPLSPAHSIGAAFWVGVGAIVLLVIVRQSLPK